jgi:hypothetical protein
MSYIGPLKGRPKVYLDQQKDVRESSGRSLIKVLGWVALVLMVGLLVLIFLFG